MPCGLFGGSVKGRHPNQSDRRRLITTLRAPFAILRPFSLNLIMLASLRRAGTRIALRVRFSLAEGLCILTNCLLQQPASAGQKRFLSIHEYQSVKLLNDVRLYFTISSCLVSNTQYLFKYGVATPKGIPAKSPEEAYEVAKNFGAYILFPNSAKSILNLFDFDRHQQPCYKGTSFGWWPWKG